MILLIDLFDSFTYNLYQLLSTTSREVKVLRYDRLAEPGLEATYQRATHLVLSPGPRSPEAVPLCFDLLDLFAGNIPVLGVCLGHQLICHYFGAKITQSPLPVHGQSCIIKHDNQNLFAGLPQNIQVARYHSLLVDPGSIPENLQISAWSQDLVMGVSHRHMPHIYGLQFHPESFLTQYGEAMAKNFVECQISSSKSGADMLTHEREVVH